jgi:hypothetical protein
MALEKWLIPALPLKNTGQRGDTSHGIGERADTIRGIETTGKGTDTCHDTGERVDTRIATKEHWTKG